MQEKVHIAKLSHTKTKITKKNTFVTRNILSNRSFLLVLILVYIYSIFVDYLHIFIHFILLY